MDIKERVKLIKSFVDADLPCWSSLKCEYDKKLHDIHTSSKFRDVPLENRLIVDFGAQRLMCDRMVQMMNTIPIERVYEVGDDERLERVKNIIEAVYHDNKIDAINNLRLHAYFASCEVATMWTGEEETHDRYGETCHTRLRMITSSPMERKYSSLNQANFYPQFDDYGGMIGFGIGGIVDGVEYLNFYTDKEIEKYERRNGEWTSEVVANPIGKIPFAYMYRMSPIYEGQSANVDVIETVESSQSQVIKRNSAPVLVINTDDPNMFDWAKSEMMEGEKKVGTSREILLVTGQGDARFVDTPINADAPEKLMKRIMGLIEQESQLPLDLSLERFQGLGNASGESFKQVMVGAHLKVGQEQGNVIEFLDRELRIVKSLLAEAFPEYKDDILNIKVEHKITPFTMDDEDSDLNRKLLKLNNGLISRREIMRQEGVYNPDALLDEYKEEEIEIQEGRNYAGAGNYLGDGWDNL